MVEPGSFPGSRSRGESVIHSAQSVREKPGWRRSMVGPGAASTRPGETLTQAGCSVSQCRVAAERDPGWRRMGAIDRWPASVLRPAGPEFLVQTSADRSPNDRPGTSRRGERRSTQPTWRKVSVARSSRTSCPSRIGPAHTRQMPRWGAIMETSATTSGLPMPMVAILGPPGKGFGLNLLHGRESVMMRWHLHASPAARAAGASVTRRRISPTNCLSPCASFGSPNSTQAPSMSVTRTRVSSHQESE